MAMPTLGILPKQDSYTILDTYVEISDTKNDLRQVKRIVRFIIGGGVLIFGTGPRWLCADEGNWKNHSAKQKEQHIGFECGPPPYY